jgi:hypothetical protein
MDACFSTWSRALGARADHRLMGMPLLDAFLEPLAQACEEGRWEFLL